MTSHADSLILSLHYACCCDEIKGNQDQKTCSHADSLSFTLFARLPLSPCASPDEARDCSARAREAEAQALRASAARDALMASEIKKLQGPSLLEERDQMLQRLHQREKSRPFDRKQRYESMIHKYCPTANNAAYGTRWDVSL